MAGCRPRLSADDAVSAEERVDAKERTSHSGPVGGGPDRALARGGALRRGSRPPRGTSSVAPEGR